MRALKDGGLSAEETGVNTPIYLALLVAVAPVVKARFTAYLLRDVVQEEVACRPRLEAALSRTAR